MLVFFELFCDSTEENKIIYMKSPIKLRINGHYLDVTLKVFYTTLDRPNIN